MTGLPDTSTNRRPIDESIALLAGVDTWHTAAVSDSPPIRMSDGPAGVRGTSWEGPSSASFPCGTALGATFDPDLVELVGRALGREAHAKSAHVLLAPTVNLHRTPIGGRNFECMSEDPELTANISAAYVRGVQSERVACCIKHFVGNDTEFNRLTISSDIDERVLRELYLYPFERAVAAGVRSIMTGYNRLNGLFCSESEWLLRDVLREEWGFDGVVCSDWFGTHSTAAALRAGLDIEMPGPTRFRGDLIRQALDAGEITEDHVTRAADRIVELGRWARVTETGTDEVSLHDLETRQLLHSVAMSSFVLLQNTDAMLPIRSDRTVALIGPYASTGRLQGGGAAKVSPEEPSGITDALQARGVDVHWERGCHIDRTVPAASGEFAVEYFDDDGNVVTGRVQSLGFLWQQNPIDGIAWRFGARISGSFVPDVSGEWEFGFRAVGRAKLVVDGAVVFDLTEDETGESFFGFGGREHTASVSLTVGTPCRVEIDYPIADHPGMRAVVAGARAPEPVDLFRDAIVAAGRADVAVVVVGTNDEWESEAEDRTTIDLPGRQNELVAAVAAVNSNTVVVVNAGSPVSMPWLGDVAAVMQIWFPGGLLGAAVADVLLGEAEPTGRLPVTFPKQLSDTPAFAFYPGDGEHAVYGEGLLIGHRWYDTHDIEPLFPFGHGLGYTTIDLSNHHIRQLDDGSLDVSVDVINSGRRDGTTVVQAYVGYDGEHPEMAPTRRFAGSAKPLVAAGSTERVTIRLPRRAFESWLDGGWVVPEGRHPVFVGLSSRSLTRVDL